MSTQATSMWEFDDFEIRAMTDFLVDAARRQTTVTYDDAFRYIRAFGSYSGPHDKRLWDLLGVVSESEVTSGRGALSALVVTKDENLPGPGFFKLEKELGRYMSDDITTWSNEVNLLFSYWKSN